MLGSMRGFEGGGSEWERGSGNQSRRTLGQGGAGNKLSLHLVSEYVLYQAHHLCNNIIAIPLNSGAFLNHLC